VSKVLGGDDLLIEILLRVNFPTSLVCAALVCRRWLRHASDPAFLRRFRELNPPCILGFYTNPWTPQRTPRFFPMLPQPPELAALIRRATSCFDNYRRVPALSTYISDCRNGNILFSQSGVMRGVLSLRCSERGMAIVPKFPPPETDKFYSYCPILSKEDDDSLSYLAVLVQSTTECSMVERKHTVHVYMLRDGVWCMLNSAIGQIPPPCLAPKPVISSDKIYMPSGKSDVVVLDLTASCYSIIHLPQGVEYGLKNTMFSRAKCAAGVYLVQIKELQLCIWLHESDSWLLVDTIFLGDTCPSLSMLSCNTSPKIKNVEDNAEFMLLEMDGCLFYLDIKCRAIHKVYEITNNERGFGEVYPFMMIWPPTFPLLKDDPSRFASGNLYVFNIYCSC
jgi:hypothetical protein